MLLSVARPMKGDVTVVTVTAPADQTRPRFGHYMSEAGLRRSVTTWRSSDVLGLSTSLCRQCIRSTPTPLLPLLGRLRLNLTYNKT